MEHAPLDALIISMTHAGTTRAEIIRFLVAQGYDIALIQERMNVLYYSGALSSKPSDVHDIPDVQALTDIVHDPVIQLPRGPSMISKIILWVRLHRVYAIIFFLSVCVLVGALVGGYVGYIRAPRVVFDDFITRIATAPALSYEFEGTVLWNSAPMYISVRGSYRASSTIYSINTIQVRSDDAQGVLVWDMDIARTDATHVFLFLRTGQSPYTFLYNRWIFMNPQTDETLLSIIGLRDVYDAVFLLHPSADAIVADAYTRVPRPGLYTSLSRSVATTSCETHYTVHLYAPRIESVLLQVFNQENYFSEFIKVPWDVCLSRNNTMARIQIINERISKNPFHIILATSDETPKFSLDVSATPISTLVKWISRP